MTIHNFESANITRRTGEGENDVSISFRSKRFFSTGTSWYFSTREGTNEGPFASRIIAHDAIQEYIRERQFSY